MSNESIRRNRYAYNNRECVDEGGRFFNQDFDEFHLPSKRVQLSSLHNWGIAQGLEVSGTVGGTTLQVNPGVAIDVNGNLISLSSNGSGSTGETAPIRTPVPVEISIKGFEKATADQTYYLTIEFNELEQRESGHPCDRVLEQSPWIRVQPQQGTTPFVDQGTAIILAQVVVSSAGQITQLSTQGRRLVGKTVQQLTLTRPILQENQVTQVTAGQLGPAETQGLQLTVPAPGDSITLSLTNGGNFTQFAVQADAANFNGRIDVHQALSVGSEATVEETLSVGGDTQIGGNLTVVGNLEVQGNVIARDTEHIAGNVVFGDADTDEVAIAGVLRSHHSSDALEIDDALHLTGPLTLDAALTVTGAHGRNYFKDAERSDGLGLRVGAAWGMYGIFAETGPGVLGGAAGVSLQNNALFIDPNNNVGIGTVTIPNPAGWHRVLDVVGPNHARVNVRSSGVTTSLFSHDNWNGARGLIGTESNHPLTFVTNNTHQMTLDATGNLGIGTSQPEGKLDVRGDIRAGNSALYFTRTDHAHSGIGNTAGHAAIENASSHDALMILGRAGTAKGRYVKLWDYLQVNGSLDVTGNVGIGTDAPQSKLDVRGDIRSEGTITANRIVGDGAVVRGMIMMWSGAANTIPTGWALCDGRNGTPDLRSRFLMGAGTDPGQAAPGSSGGPDSHIHSVDLPGGVFGTSQNGAHNHAPPDPWYDRSLLGNVAAAGKERYNAIDRGNPSVEHVRTSVDGDHTHAVNVDFGPTNTGASGGENRPRWYALCFIMKL